MLGGRLLSKVELDGKESQEDEIEVVKWRDSFKDRTFLHRLDCEDFASVSVCVDMDCERLAFEIKST
jgi:hypothetical protein